MNAQLLELSRQFLLRRDRMRPHQLEDLPVAVALAHARGVGRTPWSARVPPDPPLRSGCPAITRLRKNVTGRSGACPTIAASSSLAAWGWSPACPELHDVTSVVSKRGWGDEQRGDDRRSRPRGASATRGPAVRRYGDRLSYAGHRRHSDRAGRPRSPESWPQHREAFPRRSVRWWW